MMEMFDSSTCPTTMFVARRGVEFFFLVFKVLIVVFGV
jgi:hypothetical protein